MVRIGKVGVDMNHRLVPVQMRVPCTGCDWDFMAVLMVLVMEMLMAVLHRFVGMLMFMPFGQMQPEAQRHQCPGDH